MPVHAYRDLGTFLSCVYHVCVCLCVFVCACECGLCKKEATVFGCVLSLSLSLSRVLDGYVLVCMT